MKNVLKFVGIIAIAAVIGFSMAACGGDPVGPPGPDPISGSLPAPTGLNATNPMAGTIFISWNAVAGAEQYKLYIGLDNTTSDGSMTTRLTSYIETDITNSAMVFIRVSAVNARGEGAKSSVVSVFIQGTGGGGGGSKPSAPSGLSAAAISSTSINLTWNSVSDATGYYIYVSNSAFSGFTRGFISQTNSYTVTGAEAGTTYYFKVTAVNANGESGDSNVASATTLGGGGPVVSVTSVNVTPSTLSLNAGTTGTINATIIPNNATNQNVSWSSTDTSVATVTYIGTAATVTALKAGTARITVTTQDGNKTNYCTVTVTPAAGADNTFTSVADMRTWLTNQDANTPETAYNVRLNVNTLPRYMNNNFSSKYVNLDLSGSTMTGFETYAFEGSRTLISVILPNTVNAIPSELFRSCSGLTSVTIGTGVNSIGPSAFNGCSGLPTISIPNNVTSIGNNAFQGCTGLKSISIGTGVTNIGTDAFRGCSGLTTVTIPSNVNGIGERAFYECTGLTSVTIQNGSIGNYAFMNCSGLTSVTIGTSVSAIGTQAFRNCTSLTAINFTPTSTVTTIGNNAFQGCTNLTSVTIPNSVTVIGQYSFNGCTGLTSVIIGSSVNTIGTSAFDSQSVTTVTFLGNTVATLSTGAFPSGSNLATLYKGTNGGAGTYTRAGNTWTKS
jgi:hypothetical protein